MELVFTGIPSVSKIGEDERELLIVVFPIPVRDVDIDSVDRVGVSSLGVIGVISDRGYAVQAAGAHSGNVEPDSSGGILPSLKAVSLLFEGAGDSHHGAKGGVGIVFDFNISRPEVPGDGGRGAGRWDRKDILGDHLAVAPIAAIIPPSDEAVCDGVGFVTDVSPVFLVEEVGVEVIEEVGFTERGSGLDVHDELADVISFACFTHGDGVNDLCGGFHLGGGDGHAAGAGGSLCGDIANFLVDGDRGGSGIDDPLEVKFFAGADGVFGGAESGDETGGTLSVGDRDFFERHGSRAVVEVHAHGDDAEAVLEFGVDTGIGPGVGVKFGGPVIPGVLGIGKFETEGSAFGQPVPGDVNAAKVESFAAGVLSIIRITGGTGDIGGIGRVDDIEVNPDAAGGVPVVLGIVVRLVITIEADLVADGLTDVVGDGGSADNPLNGGGLAGFGEEEPLLGFDVIAAPIAPVIVHEQATSGD